MASITSLIVGAISAFCFTKVLEYHKEHYDSVYQHVELNPINRSTLQNFTDLQRNSVVDAYIVKTVEDIYVNVKKEAALKKPGYHHTFNPLLPIHTYPPYLYVNEVVRRLKRLFPDCDVEINHRIGVYGIYWHNMSVY
jgi:hypothetical protein